MIIFRICNAAFADDLSGNGAKLYGGRWNSKGVAMLYTAQHISLAVLEMLVNNQFKDFSIPLVLLKLKIPDVANTTQVYPSKLKNTWADDISYTKFIGNEFIKSNTNLILKVPSAVITEEHNFLINPLHKDFKKIKIADTILFNTDKRLFVI